jgi:hypothetical protein
MAIFRAVCTIRSLGSGFAGPWACFDRRNSQWTSLSVAFGDLHPFDWVRPVSAVFQVVMKFPQIPLRLHREPIDGLAIHLGRPLVPRDLPPRGIEGFQSDDLVHQAEPLVSCDAPRHPPCQ